MVLVVESEIIIVFVFDSFSLSILISAVLGGLKKSGTGWRMFDLIFKAQMLVVHFHHENFHHEHFSMLDITAPDHYVENAVCSPGCP